MLPPEIQKVLKTAISGFLRKLLSVSLESKQCQVQTKDFTLVPCNKNKQNNNFSYVCDFSWRHNVGKVSANHSCYAFYYIIGSMQSYVKVLS